MAGALWLECVLGRAASKCWLSSRLLILLQNARHFAIQMAVANILSVWNQKLWSDVAAVGAGLRIKKVLKQPPIMFGNQDAIAIMLGPSWVLMSRDVPLGF